MGELATPRPQLIDIGHLRDPSDECLRGLTHSPNYISAFKVWECFPEESFDMLIALNKRNIFSGPCGAYMNDIEDLVAFSHSITYDEAKEVYDIYHDAVVRFDEHPDRTMYYLFREAYVKVLKVADEKSRFAVFCRQHFCQYFGDEDYIDSSEVSRILNGLSADARRQASWLYLMHAKDGISKHDIQLSEKEIDTANRKRAELHKELRDYGHSVGLTDDDIISDIFFEYCGLGDNINLHLSHDRREVEAVAGVLMIKARDPDTYNSVPEFRDNEFTPGDEESYQDYLRRRAQSERILQRYLSGEFVHGPRYSSNRSGGSLEDDEEFFADLQRRFSDLPMVSGFDVYLCMHEDICCAFILRIDISSFYGKDGLLEQRFEELQVALAKLRGY